MGKFQSGRLSNVLSEQVSTPNLPEESEELQTALPVATSPASILDMPAPEQSKQSRLRRISKFLPKIKSSGTKLHKDQVLPSLPPARETSPYQHHQDAFSHPPPMRAPPPVPLEDAGVEDDVEWPVDDEDGFRYANQKYRPPPSRMAPLPWQENGEHNYRYADNHVRSLSAQYPPAPPQQTYTPPPRTNSTSPHTLDYRRSRAESLQPSQSQPDFASYRAVTTPLNSRPNSAIYYSDGEGGMGIAEWKESVKDLRRHSRGFISGLFNTSSRSEGEDVLVLRAQVLDGASYNLDYLLNAQKIPELWELNDLADLYVYMYPREFNCGPQVKCPSLVIQDSSILRDLAHEAHTGRHRARSFDGRGSLTIEDATRNFAVRNPSSPPYSPQISAQDPLSPSDSSDASIRSFPASLGPRDLHLHLPLGLMVAPGQFNPQPNESPEQQRGRVLAEQKLIDARNLFAFLNGQVIVATRINNSTFRCFLAIANMLKEFGFSADDGVSYGKAAEVSFEFYLTSRHIGDVRASREKTLEGLILGEAMKSSTLYNEAFAHAVGKYETLKTLKSPLWDDLSLKTKQWIERGYLQLRGYKIYVEERLTDFDFPSVFAGIANSTSSRESKIVRFKYWKSNFMALRKAVLSYYKDLYGSWPPKASSKKNLLVEGGLNRLVLKGLYIDLCCLYDFLVDREDITTRIDLLADDPPEDDPKQKTPEKKVEKIKPMPKSLSQILNEVNSPEEDESTEVEFMQASGKKAKPRSFRFSDDMEPDTISALRKVLDEFDRSTTWETPPMPLDTPHLPTLQSIDPNFFNKTPQECEQLHCKRKLQENEATLVLEKGHNNQDGGKKYQTPFMEMYREFTRSQGKGKTARELQEQRMGHWIFIYCVLQVLPLVVSDVPGLNYSDSVEYFLSAAPPEKMPWIDYKAASLRKFQLANGGYSWLPAHQMQNGVEAIYRRSHCWQAASSWIPKEAAVVPEVSEQLEQQQLSPLAPPPGFGFGIGELLGPRGRPRSSSSTIVTTGGSTSSAHGRLSAMDVNRLSQRNSVAFGLEQFPQREEFRRPSVAGGARTPPERDITFDDILAEMGFGGEKGKKEKKWGKK